VKIFRSADSGTLFFNKSSVQKTLQVDGNFFESGKQATTTAAVPKKDSGSSISAQAYLVGNVETGKIYIERRGSSVLPVASMSKLITAVAAIDTLASTTIVSISQEQMNVASDTSRLSAGEKFTMSELLYPLLLSSSNVAAEALSTTSDRTMFMQLMTTYAFEIGMPSTFFADPSGINPHNVSSARDFFALARYLYTSRPDILSITRIPHLAEATTSDHGGHDFTSTHPFVNDPNFIGGKTGRTDAAGETMLTIIRMEDMPLAFIVLGSRNGGREADTRILISQVKKILAE